MNDIKFKFIDLFSGLGGFHLALKKLGGNCVLASEINNKAISIYHNNFPYTKIIGDILNNINQIPNFDVLAAGFPCQPFSKAGKRKGFEDDKNGNLFMAIVEILKLHHECKIFILENVKTIANPKYWNVIKNELSQLNFKIIDEPLILSPSHFNIPQNRHRAFIIGIRNDLLANKNVNYELLKDLKLSTNFINIEDKNLSPFEEEKYLISSKQQNAIFTWLKLHKQLDNYKKSKVLDVALFGYKMNDDEFINYIKNFPGWKKNIANNSRNFYLTNKIKIDKWLQTSNILKLPKTYQKIELYSKLYNGNKQLKHIIQFRPSGIRIIEYKIFPTLTAFNTTPIIKSSKGYRQLTPKECAILQSFPQEYKLSSNKNTTYKLLGNAVNVKVIEQIFKKLNLINLLQQEKE